MARTFIARRLYPLLWLWVGAWMVWGVGHPEELQLAAAIKGGVMVLLLVVLEWRYPLDARWAMTWRHLLRRDLFFILINGMTLGLLSYGLVVLAIDVAKTGAGPLRGTSLWLQVPIGLIVFEALQYSVHRLMHGDTTGVGRFLWRSHAVHHLPQQLYVVMHAVFHPVNAIVVRLAVQLLPLWVLGYDPEAVFAIGSIVAMHGTISHLNLDLRMGPLNYLFVGPELHRYHHSASSADAVNYGAVLSVFDLVLGTFRYTPGRQPPTLGLSEADGYPGQHDPIAALLLPFRRRGGVATAITLSSPRSPDATS